MKYEDMTDTTKQLTDQAYNDGYAAATQHIIQKFKSIEAVKDLEEWGLKALEIIESLEK